MMGGNREYFFSMGDATSVPCPFCKSTNAFYAQVNSGERVGCGICGALGPSMPSFIWAIRAWEHRAEISADERKTSIKPDDDGLMEVWKRSINCKEV